MQSSGRESSQWLNILFSMTPRLRVSTISQELPVPKAPGRRVKHRIKVFNNTMRTGFEYHAESVYRIARCACNGLACLQSRYTVSMHLHCSQLRPTGTRRQNVDRSLICVHNKFRHASCSGHYMHDLEYETTDLRSGQSFLRHQFFWSRCILTDRQCRYACGQPGPPCSASSRVVHSQSSSVNF